MNAPGYNEMPKVIAYAERDIAAHLWSVYWIIRWNSYCRCVELGVRNGSSTRTILQALRDIGETTRIPNDRLHLWSFDIDGDAYHVEQKSRELGIAWVDGLWTCTQADSVEAGLSWDKGLVDLVFVDTEHSFEQTRKEITVWHRHVRPGGAMVFHDTGLNEPNRDGVTPACEQFAAEHPDEWKWENHKWIDAGDCGMGFLWRVK